MNKGVPIRNCSLNKPPEAIKLFANSGSTNSEKVTNSFCVSTPRGQCKFLYALFTF